jgi:hypothetical protein
MVKYMCKYFRRKVLDKYRNNKLCETVVNILVSYNMIRRRNQRQRQILSIETLS